MSTRGDWLDADDLAALDAEIPTAEPDEPAPRKANGNGHHINPFLAAPGEPEPEGAAPVVRLRPLLSGEPLQVPEYVIGGLVERGTYTMVYGPWGGGKSQIVTTDWAMRVALGRPVNGRPTLQGPVVIVAGEGERGLEKRALAWARLHDIDLWDVPILVTEHPVPLGMVEQLQALRAAIEAYSDAHWDGRRPVLVISDTLATNSSEGDENDNAAMGARLSAVKAHLYQPLDCAFVELHHPGKDSSRGPRGASALQGNADLVLELAVDVRDPQLLELCCTKAKDVERPEPVLYRSQGVPLDYPDGVQRTSPAVTEGGAGQVQRTLDDDRPVTGKLREFLTAASILQGIQEERLMAQGRDPASAWMSVQQLNNACRSRESMRNSQANYLNKLRQTALEKGYLVASPAGDVRLGKVHL